MNLRDRIADWISGGALTRARHDAHQGWANGYRHRLDVDFLSAHAREQSHRAYTLQYRLNRIAACETTNANGTVRRMARIAREETK